VRSTDSAYFSCNAGDDDSLGQEGELKDGDVILLTYWYGDGNGGDTVDNRDNIFDKFAVTSITHDGETAEYSFDVQILPKEAPIISWTLSPENKTINRDITVDDNTSDEKGWTYNDTYLKHDKVYYGETVFPKVGVFTKKYDWDDDNGYVDDTVHQYDTIGDRTVKTKITDAWDLTSEGSIDISVKYNPPIGKVTFDPDGYSTKVHTTEDDTITADITDEDSTITEIEHHWIVKDRDNGDVISDDTIDTNTELDYEYTKTIEQLQKHYASQVIKWNDGYDDLEFTYTKELHITNWLPLVNFDYKFATSTKMEFTPKCSDIDGEVIRYLWKLYALIPFKDGEYVEAIVIDNDSDDKVTIEFNNYGHFKMVLEATDDYGGKASYTKEFDVNGGTECVGTSGFVDDFYFIFPAKYEY
jgi:hypothetical protein